MTGYYDYVLALIPVSFLGVASAGILAGLDPMMSVPLGGLVAIGLIGHAMFVNNPTNPLPETITDNGETPQTSSTKFSSSTSGPADD